MKLCLPHLITRLEGTSGFTKVREVKVLDIGYLGMHLNAYRIKFWHQARVYAHGGSTCMAGAANAKAS